MSGCGRDPSGEWQCGLPGAGDGDQEGAERVLRVPAQALAQDLPWVHHQKHTLGADSLHRLGQAPLQVTVSRPSAQP